MPSLECISSESKIFLLLAFILQIKYAEIFVESWSWFLSGYHSLSLLTFQYAEHLFCVKKLPGSVSRDECEEFEQDFKDE